MIEEKIEANKMYEKLIITLDEAISKKMIQELKPHVKTFFKTLKDLGYATSTMEGSTTARVNFAAWLAACVDDNFELQDYTFRQSHINKEKLSEYGIGIIQNKKRNLINNYFTKDKEDSQAAK